MTLYTEFDNFISESKSDKNLYEIIIKTDKGETKNHLVWSTDAVDAIETYKGDNPDVTVDSIHAEDLSYEDIKRIKEKSDKKIEELSKKMRKLAIEYSELKKEKNKEDDLLKLIDGIEKTEK